MPSKAEFRPLQLKRLKAAQKATQAASAALFGRTSSNTYVATCSQHRCYRKRTV